MPKKSGLKRIFSRLSFKNPTLFSEILNAMGTLIIMICMMDMSFLKSHLWFQPLH